MRAVAAVQERAETGRHRLFEQIARSPVVVSVETPEGRRLDLPGVGAQAAVLADVPVRFVLDRVVSARCRDRVRLPVAFDVGCERLRLPAPICWIEWFADIAPGCRTDQKCGALIETDADGRRGKMTCYYQRADGRADLIVMAALFDLDQPLAKRSALQHRIRHQEMPHLAPLFDHLVGEIDGGWWQWVNRTPAAAQAAVAELASAIWYAVPLTLAFLELLDDRSQAIAGRAAERAQTRGDLEPTSGQVLDVRLTTDGFAEVSLNLNRRASLTHALYGARSQPCAHVVRGHLVTRAGKTFWRRAHQRGDGVPRPKVVSVHL